MRKLTPRSSELEALLMLSGVVIPERLPTRDEGKTTEEDEDDDSGKRQSVKNGSTNIRGPSRPTVEDDDSDFDL